MPEGSRHDSALHCHGFHLNGMTWVILLWGLYANCSGSKLSSEKSKLVLYIYSFSLNLDLFALLFYIFWQAFVIQPFYHCLKCCVYFLHCLLSCRQLFLFSDAVPLTYSGIMYFFVLFIISPSTPLTNYPCPPLELLEFCVCLIVSRFFFSWMRTHQLTCRNCRNLRRLTARTPYSGGGGLQSCDVRIPKT